MGVLYCETFIHLRPRAAPGSARITPHNPSWHSVETLMEYRGRYTPVLFHLQPVHEPVAHNDS